MKTYDSLVAFLVMLVLGTATVPVDASDDQSLHGLLQEANAAFQQANAAVDSAVRAGRLYEKMGFRLHTHVEIHPGQRAPIYVIALPAAPPPIAAS